LTAPRRLAVGVAALLLVALVGAACTSDSSTGSAPPSTLPPLTPTTTVPYVEPTSVRVVEVAEGYHVPYVDPIDSSHVVAAGGYDPLAGSPTDRNPPYLVVDVTNGAVEEIAPPPLGQEPANASSRVVGNQLVLAAQLCPVPEERGCAAFEVEVWRLDLAVREWTRVGSYDANQIVGPGWSSTAWFQAHLQEVDDVFAVLQVTDESESHETVRRAIELSTGDLLPAPVPWRPTYSWRIPNCATSSGALAAAVAAGDWALRVKPIGGAPWQVFADVHPAFELTCARNSIWALTETTWVGVSDDGQLISSTSVPGLRDADTVSREADVAGEHGEHPALAMWLGRDLYGDQYRDVDAEEIVLVTGSGAPALVWPAGSSAPGEAHESVLQAFGDLDWAVQLPGGRIVMPLGPDGTRLLVAE
jgi:hypothetical protein